MRIQKVITASALSLSLLSSVWVGSNQAYAQGQRKTTTWGQVFSIFRRPRSQPKGSRPTANLCPLLPASRQLSPGELKLTGELDRGNTEVVLRSHPLFYWQGDVQTITVREPGNVAVIWQWENSEEAVQQVLYDGPALEAGQAYELVFEGESTVVVPMLRATATEQIELEQQRDRLIAHLDKFKLTPGQLTRQEIAFWGDRHRLYSEALTIFLEKAPKDNALQQAFEESQQDFCERRFEVDPID